jgi:hypothetical protein
MYEEAPPFRIVVQVDPENRETMRWRLEWDVPVWNVVESHEADSQHSLTEREPQRP